MALVTTLLVGGLLCGSVVYYQLLKKPNILVEKADRMITIPWGTRFEQLVQLLEQEGIIHNSYSFRLVSHLLRYNRRVLAGAYP